MDQLNLHRHMRAAALLSAQTGAEIHETLRASSPANDCSIVRALNALADDPYAPRRYAPREADASDEVAARVGRKPQPGCLFVPVPLDDGRRDLTSAVAAGGGYLQSTQLAPGDVFVSALRSLSITTALGVREVAVTGGGGTFPRTLADAETYWLSTESTQITESTPVFSEIAVEPKTVGAYVEVSERFLRQVSPVAEAFLMSELAKAVAAAVGVGLVDGSGVTGTPLGVARTPGIGSEDGASVEWAAIVDCLGDVEAAGGAVDPNALAWAIAPDAAKILRARPKATNGEQFILADGRIDGRAGVVSSSVPSGSAIFGDWSSVIIATFGALEIGVNDADAGSVLFKRGAAGIRVLWTIDIAVLRPASFVALTAIS